MQLFHRKNVSIIIHLFYLLLKPVSHNKLSKRMMFLSLLVLYFVYRSSEFNTI